MRVFFGMSQALCEECECCSRSLAELGASVQEFWEQNPLLCKHLGDAVSRLTELQGQTLQQVQEKVTRLKKVRSLQMCHSNCMELIHLMHLCVYMQYIVGIDFNALSCFSWD